MRLTLSSTQENTWVLGLCPGPHDASAALLRNGDLFVMAEQERFSRNKAAPGELPHDAIAYCFGFAGIELGDIDAVGLGLDVDRFLSWLDLPAAERAAFRRLDSPELLFPSSRFRCADTPPIHAVRHHVAHAASSFRASGFDECAIVVIDNRGEDCSAILARGHPDGIDVLETIPVEQSLGLYYLMAAEYTGLGRSTSASGKLMGLASYGSPTLDMPLAVVDGRPVLRLPTVDAATAAARREQRAEQLREHFPRHYFPFESGIRDEPMAYKDFAASAQLSLENAIEAVCRRAREITDSRRLCLAGGVSLNCTANGRLQRSRLFDQIYVQPAAHDSGTSLGAAFEVAHRLGHRSRTCWRMEHAYWGPEYSDDEIELELLSAGLHAQRFDEPTLIQATADVIAAHGVVGWFQGRAEIGPRALGARSVLANPARRSTLVHVNKIKGREVWRPRAKRGGRRIQYLLCGQWVVPIHAHGGSIGARDGGEVAGNCARGRQRPPAGGRPQR